MIIGIYMIKSLTNQVNNTPREKTNFTRLNGTLQAGGLCLFSVFFGGGRPLSRTLRGLETAFGRTPSRGLGRCRLNSHKFAF